MRSKPTLYLLLTVAVLAAFAYFFENNRPGTREADSDAKRLVTFERDKISGLTVTDHDVKIELQQDASHHWRLKSPIADRADRALLDQVMTDLETAQVDESFKVNDDDKGKLQELGLLAPHVRLLITRNDNAKPTEILFGNDAAVEGKTYARIEGTNQVQIVSSDLHKGLQKDVNAWRDHRVVDLAATDVTRFTIKNAFGEIELQRDGTHWKIAKPLAARGDDARINDFLSQATNLTVTKFVADDKADAAAYGLADPRGVLTLYTADNAKGTELMIGSVPVPTPAASPSPGASPALTPTPAPTPAVPENDVYMRQPARQAIFTVPKSVETFLTLKPNDLRDHALARINPDTVDRIHLAPATGTAFTLTRKDKAWTLDDQPANAAGVTQLMNALNGAQAVAFVADSAAPADLAKYGLDKPVAQVRFGAFASENTAESTAGEKTVATVDFGKEDGTNVYARLEEEPFIVSVPKTVLDSVWTDPLQWQPLDLIHADPEKISSLELGTKGMPALALVHGDKGEWKAASAGTPVDTGKVHATLATLAKLRAIRWVGGPSQPTYGLDFPERTLTFAGLADDKADAGKISFGARTADLMTYARLEGKPGVFLVGRQDAETLLALAPTPPGPTPAPVPAATPILPGPGAPVIPVPAGTPIAPTLSELPTAPAPVVTPSSPAPTPTLAAPTPVATPTGTSEMIPPAPPSPTVTPLPTAAPTPVPTPASMPTPEPTATAIPTPTPVPASTPEVPPSEMQTPVPVPTVVPAPEASASPAGSPATTPPVPTIAPTPVTVPAETPAPTASPVP